MRTNPPMTPPQRRSRLRRWAILVSGWIFVFVGVLGIILPILHGILFLAIGAYLLSLESPWAKRIMDRAFVRYPRLKSTFHEARRRATRMAIRIRRRFSR